LRVLLVHDSCSLDGGAEVGTQTLQRGLAQRGIEARVFTATTGPNNIANHLCYGTTGRFRTLVQTANPSAWLALREVLKEWNPDVVHVRVFLTQLSPLIMPLLRDIPSIYHAVWYRAICPIGTKLLPDGSECRKPAGLACLSEGCLPPWDWAALMLQMRMFAAWRGNFNAFVANSHAVKQKLEEAGIGPVEVLWNGVPAGAEPAALGEKPVAVFAGRLVKEKGADILLRAFARVTVGRLVIAGEGPERQRLMHLAGQLGIQERVTFEGHMAPERLRHLFQGAWVQVVPSVWAEPFGFVAPEAMMRGAAVIASEVGGLPEIVEPGVTGLLVPPGDVEALAGALRIVLDDRDLCARMGAAGRERALQHFSESRWVGQFVEVYERLIERKKERTA
jgi:glycosyltransferase involved in cell wall biosynthesis